MSSYEQRKEPWSKEWQYLLFAAEPYVSSPALLLCPAAAALEADEPAAQFIG